MQRLEIRLDKTMTTLSCLLLWHGFNGDEEGIRRGKPFMSVSGGWMWLEKAPKWGISLKDVAQHTSEDGCPVVLIMVDRTFEQTKMTGKPFPMPSSIWCTVLRLPLKMNNWPVYHKAGGSGQMATHHRVWVPLLLALTVLYPNLQCLGLHFPEKG